MIVKFKEKSDFLNGQIPIFYEIIYVMNRAYYSLFKYTNLLDFHFERVLYGEKEKVIFTRKI